MNTLALLTLCCLVTGSPEPASGGSSGDSATPAIATRGHEEVKIRTVKGGVALRIHSPGGMGHITIDRQGETWPQNVTLEIDIKELEGVTAKTDAVSIQSGRKHADTGEVSDLKTKKTTLSKKPADRFKIKRAMLDKKPHIVIQLPPVLLQSKARSIRVQWVDFYR